MKMTIFGLVFKFFCISTWCILVFQVRSNIFLVIFASFDPFFKSCDVYVIASMTRHPKIFRNFKLRKELLSFVRRLKRSKKNGNYGLLDALTKEDASKCLIIRNGSPLNSTSTEPHVRRTPNLSNTVSRYGPG